VVDHGDVVEEAPAALPPGTRIRVEDLFGKIPARRKFRAAAANMPPAWMWCAAWPWRGRISALCWSMTVAAFWRCSRTEWPSPRGPIVARELAEDGVMIDLERGLRG
jgi:DNA mismatch repair protein MutL